MVSLLVVVRDEDDDCDGDIGTVSVGVALCESVHEGEGVGGIEPVGVLLLYEVLHEGEGVCAIDGVSVALGLGVELGVGTSTTDRVSVVLCDDVTVGVGTSGIVAVGFGLFDMVSNGVAVRRDSVALRVLLGEYVGESA